MQRSFAGPMIALIAGLLLFIPGATLTVMGVGALWLNGHRDSAGYYTTSTRVLATDTAAITAEDVDLHIDRGPGTWAESDFGQLRIRATESDGRPLFLGIARETDVDTWLRGVAHAQVRDLDDGVRYSRRDGAPSVGFPGEESFWVASASGSGTQTVTWQPETGQWALVIARADGSPGVRATVDVGAKAPSLAGLGVGLLLGGLLLIALGIVLVLVGAAGLGRRLSSPPGSSGQPASPSPEPVAPH